MPTLKGTEVSLSCVQRFLYFVSSSINVSIFHSAWLDAFWMDLAYVSPMFVSIIKAAHDLINKFGKIQKNRKMKKKPLNSYTKDNCS